MSNYLKLSQDLMSSELSRILVITYDWAMLNLNWPCKKSDVLHGQKYSITYLNK